jgi:archaetidylinositol phosphate synthase
MIDTKMRSSVQPFLNHMARPFVRLGISPNLITAVAFLLGVLAGASVAFGLLLPALVLLWISGLLDVLDGTVARLTNRTSPVGAYLDLIFDRLVEASIVIGFVIRMPEIHMAALVFLTSVIFNFSTFMVAGALFPNKGEKSMHYDVGIAERTETFLVFSLMMLLPLHASLVLWVFSGIVFLTGGIRFYRTLRAPRMLS